MNITLKSQSKNTRKFQVGGTMESPTEDPNAMPVEETPTEAAPQGGEQDPIVMLAQAAQQALQSQDCNMAMQVCQAFLQLVQQMAQGQEQAPAEPTFARKGGKLIRK